MSTTRTDRTPAASGRVRINDIPAEPQTPAHGTIAPTSPGFVNGLTEAVRANPASAALIGIGAAWLLMGGANVSLLGGRAKANRFRFGWSARHNADGHFAGESAATNASSRSTIAATGRAASAAASSVSDAAGSATAGVGNIASEAAAHGSSVFSAVADGLGSVAGRAGDAASRVGSSAFDASKATSDSVRRQTASSHQTLVEFFEDKPLALSILGLAIGAGVAAALPRTEAEQRFMGEASDAAKEQVSSVIGTKFDETKAVVGGIFEQVSNEAETQGLTKDGVAAAARTMGDKLATVVATAADSVKNEVGKQDGRRKDKLT